MYVWQWFPLESAFLVLSYQQSQLLHESTLKENHIYIKEFLLTLPGGHSTEKPTGEATTATGTEGGGTTPSGKETTSAEPTEGQTAPVGTTKQTTQETTKAPQTTTA